MTRKVRQLRELLDGITRVPGVANRDVRGLQTDSRRVQPGDLFLAVPGMVTDGRDYIGDAVASGAAAVVYETDDGFALRAAPVPVFGVSGLRHRIGIIADRFYDAPSRRMVVIGVTGTNGKTTCTQLLAQALDQAPRRCAVIGTLGYGFPGALNASLHTTPDAMTLQRLLAILRGRRRAVAMEVSSHALEQGRVNGVAFSVAVFTNLTRDHLDYHGDMQAYGKAKAGLFAMEGIKHAVINHDDLFGRSLLAGVDAQIRILSYGIEGGDVRAREVRLLPDGLRARRSAEGETELRSPLIGRFNANLLAVLATSLALGVARRGRDAARARAGPRPRGAFRRARGLPLVVADYAHTPDALERSLPCATRAWQAWCVFGCGGDRDRGKRPVMGEIAERLADSVVLTDDNPRHESGDAIIADILGGMNVSPKVIASAKRRSPSHRSRGRR
jgi:UDP-N-acetylmuramoyl-L-alanyl-D-glutamate--2,6-diaminopimelate ligase